MNLIEATRLHEWATTLQHLPLLPTAAHNTLWWSSLRFTIYASHHKINNRSSHWPQICKCATLLFSPHRIKIKPNIQSGSTSTTSGSSPRVPPAIGTETQFYNITQLALLIHLSIYRLWLCGVTETLAVNAAVAGGQSFMSDISPLTHSQAN